jgi:alanyl-tRNA synthetase
MTFLIGDGVLPSNEWRGYVLRKIMRRAMRHGKKLGFTQPTLHALSSVVVREMADHYTELPRHADLIASTIRAEEERFDAVLTSGLPKLEELLDRTAAGGGSVVSGDDVFRLYDSLGVPLDFAEDLAGQRGMTIDHTAYDQAMEGQRVRARGASAFDARKGTGFTYPDDAGRAAVETRTDRFLGYDVTSAEATVVALFDASRRAVSRLEPGDHQFVVLDQTPFYVESGGQVSDTGTLMTGRDVAARVTGVARVAPGGPRAHQVTVERPLSVGDRIVATVDDVRRDATRRNHTATHLLHAALRRQLGDHVRQAGSLVAPDRLRFDFSHFAAVTLDDRQAIERAVNAEVYRNTPVTTEERSTEEAISAGAMALFGEKYGDRVRVVSIADYSLELCGGTHAKATGDIGPFVITEETGVAAGVRRIEALTGEGAVAHLQSRGAALDHAVATLGVPAGQAAEAVARLQAEAKRLSRENEQLKLKLALGGGGGAAGGGDDAVTVGDARFVARRVTGLEKGALRGLADSLRDRLKRGVVVIAAENEGRVQLLVCVTKDLTARVKAGELVKQLAPLIGGGGGGRPDFAEAGGRDTSRIDEMLAAARTAVEAALSER